MTPEQFNDWVRTQMDANTLYRDDIKVKDPAGRAYGVNRVYCATDEAGKNLAEMLIQEGYVCDVVSLPPQRFAAKSGGFVQEGLVPWLRFPDGTLLNAGQSISLWTHGFDPKNALRSTLDDYQIHAALHSMGEE